jgi:oligopeptide transport system substrate-binding protein
MAKSTSETCVCTRAHAKARVEVAGWWVRTLLGCLFVVVFAAPHPGWAAIPPGTLERGNGPEPDSLDPVRAQGLSAHQILRDLYEGLFVEGADGHPEPGVALSWRVDAAGLNWTFELDPEARFADGRAVLAEHFVCAFQRALDPQNAAPYAVALLPVQGARARLAGRQEALGIVAQQPHQLRITLTHPSADLPARLTLPITFPFDCASPSEPASRQKSAPRSINGNGPYQMVEWRPGAWIELEVNRYHPRADQLSVRRVRFHVTEDAASEARRFEAGELHWTETVPPHPLTYLRERYGTQLHVGPALGTFFLGYNLRRPPFANAPKLREALYLAVDRELLVRLVTAAGEQPAYTLLPPQLADPAPLALPQAERVARAQHLYRESGFDATNPLRIELRFNTSSLNRRLMLAVAAMWQEHLGVQTRLRNEDWKVFVVNRRAGLVTEVFRGGWNADFADPLNFLELFQGGSALNITGYSDDDFDRLAAAVSAATSPEHRRTAAAAAEQHLLQSYPIIPLFHYTTKHLVSPLLEGYTSNPLDHHPTRTLRWRQTSQP